MHILEIPKNINYTYPLDQHSNIIVKIYIITKVKYIEVIKGLYHSMDFNDIKCESENTF